LAKVKYLYTKSLTFDLSIYNGPLDIYLVKESKTSVNKLALNLYIILITPSKRRYKGLGKRIFKAPCQNYSKSNKYSLNK
jgi:hypothetical protein